MENQFEPDYAVPPGETLREILKSKKIKQIEFAKLIGINRETVRQIILGNSPITPERALLFEELLGEPNAEFWNNLELNYRKTLEKLGKSKKENSVERNEKINKKPIKVSGMCFNCANCLTMVITNNNKDIVLKQMKNASPLERINIFEAVRTGSRVFRCKAGQYNYQTYVPFIEKSSDCPKRERITSK